MKWFKRWRGITKVSEDIQLQEMPSQTEKRCYHDWERVGSKSMWSLRVPHPTDCNILLSRLFNSLERAIKYRDKLTKSQSYLRGYGTLDIYEDYNRVCLKCSEKSLLSEHIKLWAYSKRDEVTLKVERRDKAKRLWKRGK